MGGYPSAISTSYGTGTYSMHAQFAIDRLLMGDTLLFFFSSQGKLFTDDQGLDASSVIYDCTSRGHYCRILT